MDNNNDEDILVRLNGDVLWWKEQIAFAETDISFLNSLLDSSAFKENVPNLFENLQKFKQQIRSETLQLNNIKEEINSYHNKLEGLRECDDLSCDTTYLQNHELMKNNLKKFLRNFSDYKSRVFNFTGNILQNH